MIKKFRILDLFSGAGGFSFGLEKNKNFITVVANDSNKSALDTFKNNFPNCECILGDIIKKDIQNKIIKKSIFKKVNMIIGGPPCQGFSLKGKNLGMDDPRNFLFQQFINIVKKINPEIFVIENVKNMSKACNGFFLKQIINQMENLGYLVNHGILNAKNYNIPQNRERTIIIGSKLKKIDLPPAFDCIVTVDKAISDLSYLESGQGDFKSLYLIEPKSEYQQFMRFKSQNLFNHISTNHSKFALEKLKLIPPESGKEFLPKKYIGKQKFSTTWSRLKWKEISPTIDTRFDTPSNGKNSHPFLNRAITPREAARLQSFSDDFIFYGNKSEICRQIGNAVPPLLAFAIANKIDNEYKSFYIDNKVIKKNNDINIFNKDSLKFIDFLTKENIKVDHIITDPPYKISKKNNFDTLKNRRGVNFGEWDNNFDLFKWIPKYLKLLKPNGSIIIFCSYLQISNISNVLISSGIEVKDIIIWKKTNPMPRNVERRYVQDMEFAIWGVKKKAKWIFNKNEDVPYLRSLYEYSIVSGKEKTKHPTQKKLRLMEDLIKVHTNDGDLVLDPFMGSGTTGVACKKLKRKFIGIEKNKEYFKISQDRLK